MSAPDKLGAFCERAAAALEGRGVPSTQWSCGKLEDGRPCAILEGDQWRIGFFERGHFDVERETSETEDALWFFVDWVTRGYERTRASAESTRRWLEDQGLERP
jgi:hypothetical protein